MPVPITDTNAMLAGEVRRFKGASAALAYFLHERRRRAGWRAMNPDPRAPSIPRILSSVDQDAATYAALARCWVENMPCDRPLRPLTEMHRRALEIADSRSEAWLSDYSLKVLGRDLSVQQVGRVVAAAMSVLARRYRERGLLEESE